MPESDNRIPGKGPPGVREISTFQIDDPNILKYIPRPFWPSFRSKDKKSWHPTELGNALYAGSSNLAELFRRPGGISPTLSASIAPLMAAESDRIARTGAGQMSQAAGAAARSGTGSSSMAQALQLAIERASSRDVATARRSAVGQSEQLRRDDLGRMMEYLNWLTNTTLQGRNIQLGRSAQIMQGSQFAQQQRTQQTAALIGLAGAALGNPALFAA